MARLDDGYQTLISFSDAPGLGGTIIWEKEVTPPGIDGGGMVDTTTMRNELWRTRNPKHLVTLSEFSVVVAYDPEAWLTLTPPALGGVNDNQEISVLFPDGAVLVFWGFIDKFTTNAHREGEQPTANITVVPTNQDDTGTEIAPLYIAP